MDQSIFYVNIENLQDDAREAVTEAIKHDSDGKALWTENGVWVWDNPSDYPKTAGILGSDLVACFGFATPPSKTGDLGFNI